jgi:hypothetical protein
MSQVVRSVGVGRSGAWGVKGRRFVAVDERGNPRFSCEASNGEKVRERGHCCNCCRRRRWGGLEKSKKFK